MALKSFLDGKIFAEINASNESSKYPLVIFLHGWGRSKSDFAKIDSSYNSVAFDFSGFGSSRELDKVYDAHKHAKDIAKAISELSETQLKNGVIVVGHSLGGRVAACLGNLNIEEIKGILFIGAPLIRYVSNTKSPLKFRLAKKMNKIGLISDRRMEENKKKYGSLDYRNSSGLLRESLVKIVNESYEEELAKIKCPVAFLWGENDTAAPLKTAYDAEKLVANSIGVTVVKGASHDVHLEDREIVNEVIDNLMKAI